MLMLLALAVSISCKETKVFLCYLNRAQWWTVLYSECKSQELPKFLWSWIDRSASVSFPLFSQQHFEPCSVSKIPMELLIFLFWTWQFSLLSSMMNCCWYSHNRFSFLFSSCDWFHAGASKLSGCRMFLQRPITRYEFRCEKSAGDPAHIRKNLLFLSNGQGIYYYYYFSGI